MGQESLYALAVLSSYKDVNADKLRFNQKVTKLLHLRKIQDSIFFINKATFNDGKINTNNMNHSRMLTYNLTFIKEFIISHNFHKLP
jgi:hypothetical protein